MRFLRALRHQKFISCFLILCQFLFPLQGLARGLQGSEEETVTLSAAAMAGISTVGGQTLASLIGHEGDLGAVFKDLGSPSFLKSLAANTISADLLKEVQLGRFGKALTFADKPQTFLDHGQKALTRAMVQNTLKAVLEGGGSFDTFLEQIGRETLANALGGAGARWLGEMKPELGELFHKAGHLLRGGFEGILLSRDPRTGLLTGMISGVSAETFAEWAHAGGLSKDFAASLGEFSGPLTVLLTLGDKGDIAVAANVAQNAVENNFCHEEDNLNLTEEEQDQLTEDLQEAGDWIWENKEDLATTLIPYGGTLKILGKIGGKAFTVTLSKSVKTSPVQTIISGSEKAVHKNSLKYVGDTHVYVIRDKSSGKILKYGESATGKNKFGQSKRGQAQANKLRKQNPGKEFYPQIIKEHGSKAEARASEAQYIETHRKVFGKDSLPLNKNNR